MTAALQSMASLRQFIINRYVYGRIQKRLGNRYQRAYPITSHPSFISCGANVPAAPTFLRRQRGSGRGACQSDGLSRRSAAQRGEAGVRHDPTERASK